jgi:serine/threonine protein kinase
MDDLTGQLYGGYRLIKRLHQGGEADIYTGAKPSQEEETVVIRIFRDDKATEEDIKRRYQREVKIYRKLEGAQYIIHPRSYGGVENGRYYLVMPYIAKGTLEDAINNLSPEECLTYIKQAAEALSYVHQKKLMHRDVNPRNLLLGDFGILLSDFGLACEVTTTSLKTRGNWGSPFYVAPEQRDGYPRKESDQYSLAMTMCILLTRKEPENENLEAMKNDLRTGFPNIFNVFMKATCEKPEERYTRIIEFKKALELAELFDFPPPPPPPTSCPIINHPCPIINPPRGKSSWRKATILLPLVLLLMVALIIGGEYLHSLNIPPNLFPPSLTVTTLKDNDSGSLRQVIDAAKKGQAATIRFDPSLQGTIELTKDLEISTDVNIVAPTRVSITPQNLTTTIHIPRDKDVSFVNIDFQGKNQERNSAFIVNEGTLHMRNCRVSEFKSTHGGGALDNLNGTLTFTQSEIDHNESSGGGGGAIYNFNGTVTLDNSRVYNNETSHSGGGINSLNGHVLIKNNSSIYYNKVLNKLSGGDIGGGGGMYTRGGSLSITDSSILNNTATGNGGGILLIGTSAYIDNSQIQFNTTHTDQAGGIAVIYNSENNYHSVLTLANNTHVQHNSNRDSSNSAVDIDGKILQYEDLNLNPIELITSEHGHRSSSDPIKIIISKRDHRLSSDPTTFPQFLDYLTQTQFQDYCKKKQGSQEPPNIEQNLSDAQTITCTFDDKEPLVLSTQNDEVNQVCEELDSKAENLLARLFRYTDITTWQCFKNEKFLLSITKPKSSFTSKVPLEDFCAQQGASAHLLSPKTAYDWICKGPNNPSINMDEACQYVTDKNQALAVLKDHSDPYSWQCWGPDNAKS